MDTYKSNEEVVNYDINTVYSKLSNPECFQRFADNELIPADVKERLKDVEFTSDSISFTANPVGNVTLKIVERQEPTKIELTAQPFPIPFKAIINLEKVDDYKTQIVAEFQIELNMMLRSMAAKPLGDGAKKFGQMLTMLPYDLL